MKPVCWVGIFVLSNEYTLLAILRSYKAFYNQELGEFILRYEDMRGASSPEQALLEFFQSTYEAGAQFAQWDRKALERMVV